MLVSNVHYFLIIHKTTTTTTNLLQMFLYNYYVPLYKKIAIPPKGKKTTTTTKKYMITCTNYRISLSIVPYLFLFYFNMVFEISKDLDIIDNHWSMYSTFTKRSFPRILLICTVICIATCHMSKLFEFKVHRPLHDYAVSFTNNRAVLFDFVLFYQGLFEHLISLCLTWWLFCLLVKWNI